MPCALSASIMSTKYAQEGNQQGFSVSTTSGNEMNEKQIKGNNSLTSAECSVQQISPVSLRDNTTSSLATTASRSQHSFSIDALVGNNKSPEDDTSKVTGSSNSEVVASESCSNQHHLIDLKRIQAYYQQMHNQNFSLKQLNNYMYPLGSFTEPEASKQSETTRENDQILAYYANFYLQSSNFYQKRYLESLRTFSTDTVQHNSKESIHEFFHKYEQTNIENEPEEATQRLLSKDNKEKFSSHLLSNDHFFKLKQYANRETLLSNSKKSNDITSKSLSSSDQLPQSPLAPSASQSSSLLFLGVNKPIDIASQSTLRSAGSQSVSTSLNGTNLYSSYCDYDLLDLQSKSNRLLASGNSNSATPNSLHSPQLATDSSSNKASSGGVPSGGGTAAAAAYHLSSMFRKPKRIRTAFSPGQLLRLEEIFEKNRYVVGCERKQLARDLNLSETQIKVWFQNRRTKHKREKHISVGQSGDHSIDSNLSFHNEKKSSLTNRSAPTSSSSTSSSSSSSAGYLSHGNFTMPSVPPIYGHHFKSQNSTHRTLLAK